MKRYTNLLFDLDDTIFDFSAAETNAIKKVFDYLNLSLTSEVHQKYSAFNKELWDRIDQGLLTRDQMQEKRFPEFFKKEYGLTITHNSNLIKIYQDGLASSHVLLPHAYETIKKLHHNGYYLAIISNGILHVQVKKLTDASLISCFNDLFTSREIGYMKPSKKFFNYVFQHTTCNDQNTIVIGDSLVTDIFGAINVGLDSVWYNRYKKENKTNILPTFEINDLSEINNILSN